MNNTFVDEIPRIATHLGISNLKYLHIAIEQADYYGFYDTAAWFAYWYERLHYAVRTEWNTEEFTGNVDTTETTTDF